MNKVSSKAYPFVIGATFVAFLAASGCEQKVDEGQIVKTDKSLTFQDIEDSRSIARENAKAIAIQYVKENPRFKGMRLVAHTDSSINNNCPQGDGWATLSVMEDKGETPKKWEIKCSTVSLELGCYTSDVFKEKPFAADDGKCQPRNKVPYPLPKVSLSN